MHDRRRVYIDFDDVLCETARALLGIARDEFGVTTTFDRIGSFDLGISFGLTATQVARLMDIVHQPENMISIPPTEAAVASLRSLADAACDICVVTGRPPATVSACHTWLERHGVPYSSLLFVDKYGRRHPATGQVSALSLQELAGEEFCLAVEDSVETALFLARNMPIPIVLFDRPWNAGVTWPPHLRGTPVRCRGWREILERFGRSMKQDAPSRA